MTPSKLFVNITDTVTYILLAETKRVKNIISYNACNVHLAFVHLFHGPWDSRLA
jgi:hypothetical protein